MGVVTRSDSPYFWLNLERAGAPPRRESTRILARGLLPRALRENRALAEQVYAARLGDLARQRNGLAPIASARLTFRQFAAWYLEHVTPTKRTAARERSAIGHLVGFFGRRTLDAIDQETAREYLTIRRESVQASTCNRELDVLKAMLGAAVPKHLPANPLHGMTRLRARATPRRLLSLDDERALLAVLSPADQALIIGAVDSLVRLGDLVSLRWAEVHPRHLEIHDPKSEPYRAPVSTRFRAALDALPRVSPYVFAHHAVGAGPPREASVTRMFRFACYAAGVPYGYPDGVTWHGLRHTGATRFMAHGGSIRDLMTIGGWKDVKSVLRYVRPSDAALAVVDAMSQPASPGSHARNVHAPGRKARTSQQKR